MKITHAKVGSPAATSNGKRLVTVCAELDGPKEFMTITVAVVSDSADQNVCARGIARAKEFARQFADMPLQYFPTTPGL
jgi:hypothetical protein